MTLQKLIENELATNVVKSKPKVQITEPTSTIVLELITPELARFYLTKMGLNRKIHSAKIKDLKKKIECGLWVINECNTIKFNKTGILIDGQNRLYAIILSGIAVVVAVQWNVPDDNVALIDTQQSRDLADSQRCAMQDDSISKELIGLTFFAGTGSLYSKYKEPESVVLEYYNKFEHSAQYAVESVNAPAAIKAAITAAHNDPTICTRKTLDLWTATWRGQAKKPHAGAAALRRLYDTHRDTVNEVNRRERLHWITLISIKHGVPPQLDWFNLRTKQVKSMYFSGDFA